MRYQYIISISVFDKYVSILNLHLCYSQLEIVFRWNSGFLSEAQHHLRMLAASTEPKIPLSLQPATTDSRVLCVAPTTRLKLSVKAWKGQTCSTFLNIFLWSPCVIRPNMFPIGKVCALLSNLPTWFLLHFVLSCILANLHTCIQEGVTDANLNGLFRYLQKYKDFGSARLLRNTWFILIYTS